MTQRYSHLAPEQLQNSVRLLDGVIGEKVCHYLDTKRKRLTDNVP